MCGLLFFKSQIGPIDKTVADVALNLMEWRGPDQWNSTLEGDCYLGHRRLSILDLSERGRQPFASSDGQLLIVFNGEIYNFRELRDQFGLVTHTESDTEVLIELYRLLGPRCLDHLNGMFAFVIYDLTNGDVFAARDRLGVKPLYWNHGAKGLIFSSEIAPILKLAGSATPDLIGIRQYLKLRTTFRGHTIYNEAKVFPAAHYYLNGKLSRYWDLQESRTSWNDDDIEELLSSSVRYRLVSDVPVGSYLSGGLDSSLITAMARTDQSYTVGFSEDNEFPWSALVSSKIGTEHHAVLVSPEEYRDTMKWMVSTRREPLSVPNEVLIYLMTREVKKKNTVVLSGEGADELFFGYDRIFRWAARSNWSLRGFDEHYCYGSHRDDEILDYVLEPYADFASAQSKVARFFQVDHLAGLLKRLDAATMLASVEAREPFVDYRLVEYMHGAPFDYRMAEGEVKAPLKRIARKYLPSEIVDRKKVGFPVPLAQIYGVASHKEGMDRWLDQNMNHVFSGWSELRRTVFGDVKGFGETAAVPGVMGV